MSGQLTQQELDERVAILRKFRTLLEQQRSKFREYLNVLENQHGKIEADDGEALAAHAELENQIVENIMSLQKVIVPMEHLYNTKGVLADKDSSVTKIQAELDNLRQQVLAQNERNRSLLQAHLDQVKLQLNTAGKLNPYFGKRSVYAERSSTGSIVSVVS